MEEIKPTVFHQKPSTESLMEESQICWRLFGDDFLIIHIYQGEMCRTSICRTHYNIFLGNLKGATLISRVTKQMFEPASNI